MHAWPNTNLLYRAARVYYYSYSIHPYSLRVYRVVFVIMQAHTATKQTDVDYTIIRLNSMICLRINDFGAGPKINQNDNCNVLYNLEN